MSGPGLAIALRPAAQSIGHSIDSAADPDALDDAIRLIWRGVSAGEISEDEAGVLENRAQSKRRPRSNGQAKQICATALVAKISRFVERQRPRSPDRKASRRRWLMLGASGVMPAEMRAEYTRSQLAVLWVVAREIKRKGTCRRSIDEIAARAGVSYRQVQLTLRKAARLAHLQIIERTQRGRRHFTNEIRVTSRRWQNWGKFPHPFEKAAKNETIFTL